jgi:micrococcal nuclease
MVAKCVLISTLATVLAGCSSGSSIAAMNPEAATVRTVVDGDTFHVTASGRDVTVRLLGADSPETKDPRKPVECGGPQASAFAHRMLDGQPVTLVADPSQAEQDRYGRSLRYVRLPDGTDFSVAIVSAGWARSYVFEHKQVQEYPRIEAAQTAAQRDRRGLWGTCPNPAPGD